MFDELEALFALKEMGTMGKAALRLRITQSAVSKRIQSLENRTGAPLTEATGRNVRLTEAAEKLLLHARPLLAELKSCLHSPSEEPARPLSMGVSESLLASFAPRALARVLARVPGLALELHAHRSPVIVEHVRSGRYQLGLCAEAGAPKELHSLFVAREPMVLIPSGLKPFRWVKGQDIEVLAIEPSSATWAGLSRQLAGFERASRIRLVVTRSLESFTAIAQLARAGFGHALVPFGVATALGLGKRALLLPGPGLMRELTLIGRRSVLAQPRVARAIPALRAELGLELQA